MFVTDGLKQDVKGNYMLAINKKTGKALRINIPQEIQPSMTNVVLTTATQRAHIWNYDEEQQRFVATVCGKQDCKCCTVH